MNKYAGFWLRLLALFLDVLILSILLAPIVITIEYFNLKYLTNFIYFLLLWPYYSILESSKLQGTLGKYLIGIKVVDYNYNRIDFNIATLRYVSSILSSLTIFIGYIMALFTSRKQTLHDIISKTLVIRKK